MVEGSDTEDMLGVRECTESKECEWRIQGISKAATKQFCGTVSYPGMFLYFTSIYKYFDISHTLITGHCAVLTVR